MGSFYDTDLDGWVIFSEIIDYRFLLETTADVNLSAPDVLLSFIVQFGDDLFPNLRARLQLLLNVTTSIACCERSFSKLSCPTWGHPWDKRDCLP